jgi:hypothetical protein
LAAFSPLNCVGRNENSLAYLCNEAFKLGIKGDVLPTKQSPVPQQSSKLLSLRLGRASEQSDGLKVNRSRWVLNVSRIESLRVPILHLVPSILAGSVEAVRSFEGVSDDVGIREHLNSR